MTVTNRKDKAAGRVLLPDYVTPIQYDLNITPDLVNFIFDGIVNITMTTATTIPEDSNTKLTLHAKELLFRKASFQIVGEGDSTPVVAEEVRLRFCTCH